MPFQFLTGDFPNGAGVFGKRVFSRQEKNEGQENDRVMSSLRDSAFFLFGLPWVETQGYHILSLRD